MSDSVRPHPWDSPGKNTGVGYHFLFQCFKMKGESEVTQLCPTLSNLIGCGPPGSSVHGTLQTGVLEWVAISFSEIMNEIVVKGNKQACFHWRLSLIEK